MTLIAAIRYHRAHHPRRCFYCGVRLLKPRPGINRPEDYTRDHVQPKSRFGGSHRMNLVPCCRVCNQWKDAQSYEEFRIVFSKPFWHEAESPVSRESQPLIVQLTWADVGRPGDRICQP